MEVRAAVLAAQGRSFCAGANFGRRATGPVAWSSGRDLYAQAARLCRGRDCRSSPPSTGPAIGGGLGLAMAATLPRDVSRGAVLGELRQARDPPGLRALGHAARAPRSVEGAARPAHRTPLQRRGGDGDRSGRRLRCRRQGAARPRSSSPARSRPVRHSRSGRSTARSEPGSATAMRAATQHEAAEQARLVRDRGSREGMRVGRRAPPRQLRRSPRLRRHADRAAQRVRDRRTTSSGDGQAVLFTHGYQASQRDVGAAARGSATPPTGRSRGTCAATASRGSPTTRRSTRQELMLGDMLALLDHLGVDRAVLVGHSLGGFASLRFYLEHPERVAALVLFGSGPGFRDAGRACEVERDGRSLRGWDGEQGARHPPARGTRGAAARSTGRRQALAHAARGMLAQQDSKVMDAITEISVPTLVDRRQPRTSSSSGRSDLHGEEDPGRRSS